MSYRLRLIITIVLLIAITFSVGGTILLYASFQISLNTATNSALDSYKNVMNMVWILTSVNNRMTPQELGEALAQMTGENVHDWQAVSFRTEETKIFGSRDEMISIHDLPNREVNQCTYLTVSDQYGTGLLVGSRVEAGGMPLDLWARFDLSHVYETRDLQQRLYLTVYAVVLFFGIITAVVLSFVLTRKLRRLTTAVRKISEGNLSIRSDIQSIDEFGRLSRDFDAMTDKLQENIQLLESHVERQENFMGAFAHELKTPMTSIIGFADLLRQGNLDENSRIMAAEYIHSEGHRLERLSFKLLDLLLLQKDQISMKTVWIPGFISEIDKALTPTLRKKGISFICRAEEGKAEFEPDLVKSLLYNLVDNAAKAIEGQGVIVLNAAAADGCCRFQVTDNGRGMEKEELSKIMDAFYRVDKVRSRAQGGAGLGLALCRQIVQLHDGTIRFSSVPGKGTSVRVELRGKAEDDQ